MSADDMLVLVSRSLPPLQHEAPGTGNDSTNNDDAEDDDAKENEIGEDSSSEEDAGGSLAVRLAALRAGG